MNVRPFFNASLSDLEAEFARRSDDPAFLKSLLSELDHRSTVRASRLRAKVAEEFSKIDHDRSARVREQVERELGRSSSVVSAARKETVNVPREEPSSARHPFPPITNTPEDILGAWTALEVLSPQSFRRPEELAEGGDRRAVAWLDRERLPWEGTSERARPGTKLFYQVVLGTIDLDNSVGRLLSRYSDSRVERPAARGEAILAIAIVSRDGLLVESPAVFVSSFAWGLPRALRDDLTSLADWSAAEKLLVEGLDEVLRRGHEDGEARPLDRATILAGWEWLVARLDLPGDLVAPPRFAIRSYEYYKSAQPPEPLLLNSFFLKDLTAARLLFSEGRASSNLHRYVGHEVPSVRRDLLLDDAALEEAVAPGLIPPARWPGPRRYPLVLLQQAAVNVALRELTDTGILAVNGPPGTGKTTLLRDLVAGVVTARAEAMASFDDPAMAFEHSGQRLRAGQAWLHLYRISPRLKGFEMLVASSNNKAVENVTAELPAIAIAEDADDLRYLSTLSDALLERKTWGLVAAVLGNAANRARFKRIFWWDHEVGLATYLAEAAGTPQLVEVVDPDTGISATRPPRIVEAEKPPRTSEEASRGWRRARQVFRSALERSRDILSQLARIRSLASSLSSLEQEAAEAAAALAVARHDEAQARSAVEAAHDRNMGAEREVSILAGRLAGHDRERPGLLGRIFRTRRAREWTASRIALATALKKARQEHLAATESLAACAARHQVRLAEQRSAEERYRAVVVRNDSVRREVATARDRIGRGFVDRDFFSREPRDKHQAVPWLTAAEQRARDDVFVAAVALHKAFIDAAAKPIRHNLGALMNAFGGRALPKAEARALMLDLWVSLFLVVPVVSTTFASVERMLGHLPAEGLGWLFVDEAGQALPQAAVGALMRSRRAVIVGDPMQIEPIVMLPDSLTHAICRQFGIDPDRFNAPAASVQTLADAATPYSAEFQDKQGSRIVGVPLLVHRRCCEPMFGVANAIAYGQQMVPAKEEKASPIGEILGPTTWFDVSGGAMEKWCPEEGEVMMTLLRRIAAARIRPDLYVVTPFVVVADNLRKLVRESGFVAEWTTDPWSWTRERIGTVHTVQGREAEAVIFVLGAPAAHQIGARNWAGGRPNLLNVAVTRAKERLYVVGNRSLWREAGVFRQLDARLPTR